MLDIKYLINNKTLIQKALSKRGVPSNKIEVIFNLYEQWKSHIQKVEEIKAKKNLFNKEIAKLKQSEKTSKIKEMTLLTKQEEKFTLNLVEIKETFDNLMNELPNIPANDVKIGVNDKDNFVFKKVGEIKKTDFKLKDYLFLSSNLDLIDIDRAAKISGSRFSYLKNDGCLLWFALFQYSLNIVLKEKFIPFISPVLVKKEVMQNSGYDSYLEGQEAYYIEKDELFLVGTGEHALLPYHSGEIINEKNLPLYYTTYSTCFRREAGSYGKDTKGILRVHQFDKQEMLIICRPESSWQEFDHILSIQESIIKGLALPYQLLSVCTGDLPKPSTKVVDLECWIPSENKYRETHSASNCTDYQARRNNIRYKNQDGKNIPVHILNGTVITPRTMIAILENYQNADGSISIPKVLQPYMNGREKITNAK